MECTVCNHDKVPYEFPVKKNHPLICFDCDGDVECIYCHEMKSSLMFRVMGKVCTPCKIARKMPIPTDQMQRFRTFTYDDSLIAQNAEKREIKAVSK